MKCYIQLCIERRLFILRQDGSMPLPWQSSMQLAGLCVVKAFSLCADMWQECSHLIDTILLCFDCRGSRLLRC